MPGLFSIVILSVSLLGLGISTLKPDLSKNMNLYLSLSHSTPLFIVSPHTVAGGEDYISGNDLSV